MFGKRKSEAPMPASATKLQAELPAFAAAEMQMPASQAEADAAATAESETLADKPESSPLPPLFKESDMARSPFAPPPLPAAPMSSVPLRAQLPPTPVRDAERRTLVVGRGISVQGTVQDAERLVVEGTVEANSINGLTELSIAYGGMFKGEVEVEDAEVGGTIDGTLVARQTLVVRSTGRVLGTARCRRLQVEDGGQITGRIEMLTEGAETQEA